MEETIEIRQSSIFDVIRDLRDDVKTLLQDEVQLAKTEVSQKVRKYGKNAVWLAIGGVLAYAGFLLLLAGLGALLASAYASAGLSNTMSWFLGLLTIGLLTAIIGGVFVMKAVKTLSKESLAPERTVQSIKEIRGTSPETQVVPVEPEAPKRSAAEIESAIVATRNNMEKRMEEIHERLSPRFMGKRFVRNVRAHPLRSSLIGVGTGLAGYLAIKRRTHNHK